MYYGTPILVRKALAHCKERHLSHSQQTQARADARKPEQIPSKEETVLHNKVLRAVYNPNFVHRGGGHSLNAQPRGYPE